MIILDFIIALIVFAIIITIVITVHELGHFLAARKTKTRVDAFSVGFPPFIYKKKKGNTLFTIGAIPFGGYNAIYGEDPNEKGAKENPESFLSKTTRQKVFIIISGALFNLILAILLFYVFLIFSHMFTYVSLIVPNYEFPLGTQTNYEMISHVKDDSPAEKAGLAPNDIILSINGEAINSSEELTNSIEKNKGNLNFLVEDRKTQERNLVKINEDVDRIGIGYSEIAKLSYDKNAKDAIFSGFFHAYNFTEYSFVALGNIIGKAFQEKNPSLAANAVAGPVGLFAITKITIQEGFLQLINITAIISLALAITNLLPLPALDGGKCLYLWFQKINPKFFTDSLSSKIDQVGFVLLIIVGILIVFKDVFQFKDLIF